MLTQADIEVFIVIACLDRRVLLPFCLEEMQSNEPQRGKRPIII